jgi:Tfp pilus assembly protein PilN
MSGLEASIILIVGGGVVLGLVAVVLGGMFFVADRFWWSR